MNLMIAGYNCLFLINCPVPTGIIGNFCNVYFPHFRVALILCSAFKGNCKLKCMEVLQTSYDIDLETAYNAWHAAKAYYDQKLPTKKEIEELTKKWNGC